MPQGGTLHAASCKVHFLGDAVRTSVNQECLPCHTMLSKSPACMQTLCALVSHDTAKQRWLQSTGILALLQRLTKQDSPTPEAVPRAAHPILESLGENTPLGIWRQSARIIAMISADASSQTMIRSASFPLVSVSPSCCPQHLVRLVPQCVAYYVMCTCTPSAMWRSSCDVTQVYTVWPVPDQETRDSDLRIGVAGTQHGYHGYRRLLA